MYQIIREHRKSVVILVKEEGQVVIKAPHYVSQQVIENFIKQKESWIQKRLRDVEKEKSLDWWGEQKISFLGTTKKIIVVPIKKGENRVELEEDSIFFYTTQEGDAAKACFLALLKRHFLGFITPLVDNYCLLLGCKYNKITIRKQKTRWGSCSSGGNLSYNLQLIGAPVEVIQYVLLHEVMHLRHFDHSKAFWDAIEQVMPDYAYQKAYLKQHSRKLKL